MPLLFCRLELQPISSLISLFGYLHVRARTGRVENSQVGGKEQEDETTFCGISMDLIYMIVKIHPVLVPCVFSEEDKYFNV